MRSASQYSFATVPQATIPRSAFRRSRTYKTTLDAGYLVPVFIDEVLPGDTYNVNLTSFMRLTTPVVPFMDNLYADFFFFFVPNRLVWDDWTKFCGERDSPVADYEQDTVYSVPQLKTGTTDGAATFAVGSLGDYFGLPSGVAGLSVSVLPFRAYNLIWQEWFRDENLQDAATVNKNGNDETWLAANNIYPVRRRGKRHDYFTSCLPWPQKGPGVEIPLGGTAPVIGDGTTLGFTTKPSLTSASGIDIGLGLSTGNENYKQWSTSLFGQAVGTVKTDYITGQTSGTGVGITQDPDKSGLVADLSAATAATINSLREAFQVQKLYERDARGGTRYFEILRSHFGVISPDSRLQRPEYLGGGQIPIQIHAVAQTSSTDATTPQGNLAATGTASGHVGFSKSFVEHGIVIGLVSIRADLTYQRTVDRMWSRKTRFDFYWPALAHLGEQAVLNKEIFAQGTSDDDDIFGYQERWSEYRYGVSKITGLLNSHVTGSLDVWHLSQKFASLPVLSDAFIQDNPPVDRVLAVQNAPHFLYDSLVSVNCVRPMPTYSVPGLIDHF